MGETKIIDPTNPPKVEYCIPLWLRDLQIRAAIARGLPSVKPVTELTNEPIALVGYGPSLNDTWEQIKGFKYVMSCSGSHKFLVEHGIIPTHHLEVDPREHKVQLIGQPQRGTTYMIASTCHPKVFDHLTGYDLRLWHVFDSDSDARRFIPAGEWCVTGGCSVGVRMFTISRFLGFTDLHIFGMDGSQDDRGKHAATHPMQPPGFSEVTYEGKTFQTTSSMYAVAQGIWHELDQLKDCTAKFYGDGLIQHMAKFYKKKDTKGANIAVAQPELISTEYKQLNAQLHQTNLLYGVGGGKHAKVVRELKEKLQADSILDYGCGKGRLAEELGFPIWEYDPAIPGKDIAPRSADLVVCTDVLEHIEPDKILPVLADLRRVTKKVGYFTIHTGPAQKTLPDGRNTHLIQQGRQWWKNRLKAFFTVGMMKEVGPELHCVVTPKVVAA